MQVTSKTFVNSILFMPNREVAFDADSASVPLAIVAEFAFGDVARIYLTKLGAIGLQFLPHGPLASIEQLEAVGSGAFAIPGHVTENRDALIALQSRRLLFANFIAGALFGRLGAIRHSSLSSR